MSVPDGFVFGASSTVSVKEDWMFMIWADTSVLFFTPSSFVSTVNAVSGFNIQMVSSSTFAFQLCLVEVEAFRAADTFSLGFVKVIVHLTAFTGV